MTSMRDNKLTTHTGLLIGEYICNVIRGRDMDKIR